MRSHLLRRFIAVTLLALLAVSGPALAAPPDLTQGGKVPDDAKHQTNLGATGARGWIYSDKMVHTDARQIAVTKVEPGSPADGVLEVGDVILGVGGARFTDDPRKAFGEALTRAESAEQGGKLELTRWRSGETEDVVVQLAVMGSYAATAPFKCEKSRRILEQGCAWLAEQMEDPNYRRNPYERSLNAMALLASGEAKYLPLVKREAELAAASKPGGYKTWWYGPVIVFLSEYVIATGDRTVMEGLERLTLEAAEGQSDVGSWGHRFAIPETGRLMGYGMMNAPGVPLTIGLVLAREAGVKGEALDLAIERSARMLRFYAGKGSIPYGDHAPWIQTHDDNGKNGMGAVLFSLLGEKDVAEYFSRMSVACHGSERDTGHTGNFFNIFWAMPGVALSGPNASGAWMAEYGSWYFDLARAWDGRFVHLGPPQNKTDSYARWDCTGADLIAYAMPLKKLRLTGKGKTVVPQMSAAEARSVVIDGRGWDNKDRTGFYDALTTPQLIERLSSWSPVVRDRAAIALGRRKAEVVPDLVKLLGSDDLYTRYGASVALKHMRGDRSAAVPALVETLDADDLWLRILAAEALRGIGEPARVALPTLLRRIANASENIEQDPRLMEQRYLTFVLFSGRGGLLTRSLDGVDTELIYDAVRAGLQNEDGRARSTFVSVYRKLDAEQIKPLLPAIHRAVIEPSPSGIMFASEVRVEGLKVLAKHHVEEGIDAGAYLLENQNPWGNSKRTPRILESIVSYGAHAQRVVPTLERVAQSFAEEDARKRLNARSNMDQVIREAIDKIQASNDKPELISIGINEKRISAEPAKTF